MSTKVTITGTAGEFRLSPEERARAVRVVASAAIDADECQEMLGMLGLDPRDGLSVPRARLAHDESAVQQPLESS
ncbi:hypothetical protein [Umezawaea sp. NPDC059074]|uniref:hypothetical protein n=1 Tax=Umezawaea sp. NPDC059074 TaxID=3346716 RepID=UPI0036B31534